MGDDITKGDVDLTHEVPTDRAVVHRRLEKAETVKLEVKGPAWLGGGTFTLTAAAHAGSPQSIALTTFLLVAASCLITGVASVSGVPALTALIIGLCVPIGIYGLVRLMSSRWTR